MRRASLLLCCLALAAPLLALAQSDDPMPNTAIPACDADELSAISEAVVPSLEVLDALRADLVNATATQLRSFARRADALALDWHTEVLPDLPRCAMTYELDTLYGQFFDEMLITFLYFNLGDADVAEPHSALYFDLNDQINAYMDRVLTN